MQRIVLNSSTQTINKQNSKNQKDNFSSNKQPKSNHVQQKTYQAKTNLSQIPFSSKYASINTDSVIQRKLKVNLAKKQHQDVHHQAKLGVQGRGVKLPYFEQIQRAFPQHDLSTIQTFTGASAKAACNNINAKAYATKNSIAFDNPNPDLHTVAHEAVHLLQQRNGVKLTNGVSHIGDRYERQADSFADKIVRGESINQNTFEPTTSQATGINANQTVVQKKAGIEYETGIKANDNGGFIPQDDVIWNSGHGWEIVSDNSKLEFVTTPAVEINQLGAIVTNMLDTIDAASPLPLDNETAMDTFFHDPNMPHNINIEPYKQPVVSGSPQATIGIPFKNLPQFFSLLQDFEFNSSIEAVVEHKSFYQKKLQKELDQYGELEKSPNAAQVKDLEKLIIEEENTRKTAISPGKIKLFGNIDNAVKQVIGKIPSLDTIEIDELSGLLHLIAQYIFQANDQSDLSYKKKLFTVMTRSSFRSMYEALSKDMKQEFINAVDLMMQILGINPAQLIFPLSAKKHKELSFNAKDWINSILNPTDVWVIENNDWKKTQSDLMTAPGIVADKNYTDNSMGQIGLDGGLVVVELRSLKHFVNVGLNFTTRSMRYLAEDLEKLYLKATKD